MFAACAIWRSGSLIKKTPFSFGPNLSLSVTHSFVIIAVSGLFVGFVLGLQGYYTLTPLWLRTSSGLYWLRCRLPRELGPSDYGFVICWSRWHVSYRQRLA